MYYICSSLVQLTVEDNFSRKWFFNFVLNSFLGSTDFNMLSGNSHHKQGKLTMGKNSLDASLQGGIKNSRWFLRMGWSTCILLSELRIHVELKDWGRALVVSWCINWSLKNWTREGQGKIFDFLKSGSVWALKLASLIILIAFVCLSTRVLRLLELVQLQI